LDDESPIDGGKQKMLNMNWAKSSPFIVGVTSKLIAEKKAILNHATYPIPANIPVQEANLRLSQYREIVDELIDGLSTFLAYPVFDNFEEDREVVGVISTNIYWKILFSNLLPSGNEGIICVVENSLNQTFSYRIDGPESSFIGMGDHHDSQYDDMEISADVSDYLEQMSGPQKRAYGTVPLSRDMNYRIRVFPSKQTEQHILTNEPITYTMVVISGFAFASILFLLFSYVVERRQKLMIEKVLENAHKAAVTERELNEFLSHEVRNPLSAAISACSFVSAAVNEAEPMADEETSRFVREDIEVVNSSLHFINDFLRSMLDIHRDKHITVQLAPVDLLRDILEPVSNILYKRVASFEVIVDCPENLFVMTDSIRLKQVVLNLVRNSSKFVEKGFLRMRAAVVNGLVKIYVEDSGPGISADKRKELFIKYQKSLDLLSQGTGIGLNLSKKLMKTLNGDLYLDDLYHSGIEGCPGACFVIDLNSALVDIEKAFQSNTVNSPMGASELTPSTLDIETGRTPQNGLGCRNQKDSLSCGNVQLNGAGNQSPLFSLDSAGTESGSEEVPSQIPPNLSVLFVDDDVVLRKLFVRGIKKVAPLWKIEEASSGETALRLCEMETFDLIFLDQYMASVDKQLLGTETAQTMRRKGVESKICGLSANDLRDAFINSGADEFMLKPLPCKPADLEKALLGILQGNRAQSISKS
jgi:signal transduction histidine kinase/CheY-like chemotaxis protein